MSRDREYLVERMREDLLGPHNDLEYLRDYPSDVYLTGILYPPKVSVNQHEVDQLQAEGAGSGDSNVAQDEVSLATVKRPASAGLSFALYSEVEAAINITLMAARYERVEFESGQRLIGAGEIGATEESSSEASEETSGKPDLVWHRIPIKAEIDDLVLKPGSVDIDDDETGVKGLSLHVRTSHWDEKLLVTVAMVNVHEPDTEFEKSLVEEKSFFQTVLEVRPCRGTALVARPLKSSAVDEDSEMAKLIYRDVKEYAVGHTCSANWVTGKEEVGQVNTDWIPRTVVPSMSSEGVAEFRELTDENGSILDAGWLSDTEGSELVSGLRKLPALYEKWLKKETARISNLPDELKPQADKHVANARLVAGRMTSAIDLIESDSEIQDAFRLANRAILLQRIWSEPEDTGLRWRPFQLGFILLSLESVADRSHPDRQVADLLWFPTGGGKTEAYLGLIAFLIFVRRIRYGDRGAGVASFMRYTMRLLTIQQFQRASTLICACEWMREGNDLPAGIDSDLTDIPISIGLWVGGDATPNKFETARKSLADDYSPSRPDQLKYCPRHQRVPLNWVADPKKKEIHAFCEDSECLWSKRPLPVWTVDTDVYAHTPSLIIGTVDKYAQIARNESTLSLFGNSKDRLKPDLIIQDELHLISGPLGTLAGLYEVAVDRLCSDGETVPKVIASTATIRQASGQIRELFNRNTCLFPPPVLDAENSGFAVVDNDVAGRLYLGLTSAGRSAKFTLQAASASLLQAVSTTVIPDYLRDEYWTLVAYFNSLRELGGALVLMQDDVRSSIANYADVHNEPHRELTEPMELTSRVNSSEIKEYLDLLNSKWPDGDAVDVVLASNMISVGVDVPRLGAMVVNGQPKSIAEYIQSTSRVGRKRDGPGGLIVSLYNNAKARDRSHYETFQTWHRALYREVEATSVTPFAPRAREKALHAVLVILARHLVGGLTINVQAVDTYRAELEELIAYVRARAETIDREEASNVEDALRSFLQKWIDNAPNYKTYWNDHKDRNFALMLSAEKAAELKARSGVYYGLATPTPNSMRNVEPGTLFILKEDLS
jgi:hypothetical protein